MARITVLLEWTCDGCGQTQQVLQLETWISMKERHRISWSTAGAIAPDGWVSGVEHTWCSACGASEKAYQAEMDAWLAAYDAERARLREETDRALDAWAAIHPIPERPDDAPTT